jgi:hypothetical protein
MKTAFDEVDRHVLQNILVEKGYLTISASTIKTEDVIDSREELN